MTVSPHIDQQQVAASLLTKLNTVNIRNGNNQIGLLEWTIKNRMMLRSGFPFDLAHHLYTIEMYRETGRKIVWMKAGQVTVSELLVSYALWTCDIRKSNVLYVMPTTDDVGDFSRTRFGPAIEASAYLAKLVVTTNTKGQRGADKVTLKRIRNNYLFMRGANIRLDGTARQLKSVPADGVILDEYDEMDPRAPALAEKRLGHSSLKEMRYASTPTYTGIGIDTEWALCDQREWHVPCVHCGEWQELAIKYIVTEWDDLERPAEWHGKSEGDAYQACIKCGKKVNHYVQGEWVPKYPDRETIGFRPHKLMTPQTRVIEIINNLQTTDETKKKEAFNQDLAMPYTPKGGRLSSDIIDGCRRDYGFGPITGVRTVIGIDVGNLIHITIRGDIDLDGKRRLMFAGVATTFKDVYNTCMQYDPRLIVIDALPEVRKAREFQSEFKDGICWLAYFVVSKPGTKNIDPIQWDAKKGVVNLDRTRVIDTTFSRFLIAENTVPMSIRSLSNYYTHMTNLVRVLEDHTHGHKVARYISTGADHYAFSEAYATAASMRNVGWARGAAQ